MDLGEVVLGAVMPERPHQRKITVAELPIDGLVEAIVEPDRIPTDVDRALHHAAVFGPEGVEDARPTGVSEPLAAEALRVQEHEALEASFLRPAALDHVPILARFLGWIGEGPSDACDPVCFTSPAMHSSLRTILTAAGALASTALIVIACGSSDDSTFGNPDGSTDGSGPDGSFDLDGQKPDTGDPFANDPPPPWCRP